jgi:hypothetical protein
MSKARTLTRLGLGVAAAASLVVALSGCGILSAPARPSTTVAPAAPGAVAAPEAAGEAGDEPTFVYVDQAKHFSFEYPQSWGKTTQPEGEIRVAGRDEFISIKIVTTALSPLDFGSSDEPALASASSGYQSRSLKSYQIRRISGAVREYTWQAGPSLVTGKMVPSMARRYYLPGPSGQLAILTYSSPVQAYDPEAADDLANTLKWLP